LRIRHLAGSIKTHKNVANTQSSTDHYYALGAIGEIVGAIAVVITLLYLASQAKSNTLAINRAAIQATLDGTR